jgi:hypothetical protein
MALPSMGVAQRATVLPVDEAVRDPEFFVFRARLQAAVASYTTAELLRVVAPDILNGFGGDGGPAEFRQKWGLAQPERSELWGVLGFVLALGGSFDGDTAFYAPYTFAGTPGDGFETLAGLCPQLVVRAKPLATSPAIHTVSFEVVTRWREGDGARCRIRAGNRFGLIRAGWAGCWGGVSAVRSTTERASCADKAGGG